MTRTSLMMAGAVAIAGAAFAQQPGFTRTMLQQVDLSAPGREVVTARVEINPGIGVGRHTHPGEEVGYIVEGTVLLEVGGATRTLKGGEAFVIPSGTPHNATNSGSGKAVVLANYIVEKGKPLATPVK